MTPPRRRALAAAATLLLVGLAAPAAHADDAGELLEQAQRAIDDTIDYQAAATLVARAIDRGGLEVVELARAYHLAGEIAAALGDGDAARDHYLRWILIDPHARLDAGMSPKLAQPFAAAQAEARRLGGFSVEPRVERVTGKVRVSLDAADPLALIASFEVRARGGGQGAGRQATAVVELAVDDTVAIELEIRVLDARGNQLAVRSRGAEAQTRVVAAPVVTSRRWPTLVRWPTWTVLAGVSAGVGGYFAWQLGKDHDELAAINAAPELYTFDDALEVRDRGDRNALGANLGFAVAGMAAVAAILTFVLEPGDVEVTPLATARGAGASAALRF